MAWMTSRLARAGHFVLIRCGWCVLALVSVSTTGGTPPGAARRHPRWTNFKPDLPAGWAPCMSLVAPPVALEPTSSAPGPVPFTSSAATHPGLGAVIRRVALSITVACAIPAALFYGVFSVAGVWVAIGFALTWSYGALIWRAVTGRRTSGLLVLTAAVLTGRTLISVAAGSTFLYFFQPIVTDTVIGLVFLASLLGARPLVARLAGDFYPMTEEIAARPRIQRLFRVLTAMWALLYLGQGDLHLVVAAVGVTVGLRAHQGHHGDAGELLGRRADDPDRLDGRSARRTRRRTGPRPRSGHCSRQSLGPFRVTRSTAPSGSVAREVGRELAVDQDERHLGDRVAAVGPGVVGAALDDHVAGVQGHLGVVEDQRDLALEHDAVVDRLGAVHR